MLSSTLLNSTTKSKELLQLEFVRKEIDTLFTGRIANDRFNTDANVKTFN